MANLIDWAIGLMFVALIIIKVAVPVVKDAINTANLDPTEAAVAGLITLFMILGLAYVAGAPLLGRGE